MAKKSKKAKLPIMTVTFTGGNEVDVEFNDFTKLSPGKIERSFNYQIRAWELERIQAVNAHKHDEFQRSLDASMVEGAQQEEAQDA